MMLPDRGSTAPVSFESAGQGSAPPKSPFAALVEPLRKYIPQQWFGMSGYLVAGVFLGLVLIVVLSVSRGGDANKMASAGVVTDSTVHLHAKDIGDTCWAGLSADAPAHLNVQMTIGVDGRVASVNAVGASPVMKGCIETHVRNWEFLPQARPWQESLPFEVDRR